jgi:mono/diheme cytochrome c family protein
MFPADRRGARRALLAAAFAFAALAGCRQDMHDQPRVDGLQSSDFYPDGRAARAPVEGTVARGGLREDDLLYTGTVNGEPADRFPFPVDRALMDRGHERFDIFCSPCHDRLGTGRGMVVRRGFPEAASFHVDRLREAPAGYFFDVITRGFGRMPPYAAQIPVRDRWAIVAYVRALQLSQGATIDDVPEAERTRLLSERVEP